MDAARDAPRHTVRLMRSHVVTASLVAALLIACACQAQRVVLPGGAGGLRPDAAWTVLRHGDLKTGQRPTDPADAPGRARLLATIAELRQQQLTESHLLLHARGPAPGQLRVTHAYAAEGGADVEQLTEENSVTRIREVLEPALGRGGREVRFEGCTRSDLFAAGGARLRFAVDAPGLALTHDHYIVPAGDQLQYFDCSYDRADAGAGAAVEALLSTYDGGAPPPTGSGALWGAGLAGALAGVVTALARRKRQARLIAAQNAAPPASS